MLRYTSDKENIVADSIFRNISEKKKLNILKLSVLDMAEVVFDKNYLIIAKCNEVDLLNQGC